MIDPDTLHVWHGTRLVGYLWRDDLGKMAFRYDSVWIDDDGFSISRSIPLQQSAFENTAAHHFFANLLPEGNARLHIVRDLKIADSDFELLREIGGECAGALSILPDDETPSIDNDFQALSDVELSRIVRRRGLLLLNNKHTRHPRLSLAGAQDKLPVYQSGHKLYLPVGSSPSTHILKFEVPDYKHMPAYETYLTWLAHSVGMEVINISFHQIEAGSYSLSIRYDRTHTYPVQRLHQEDFCQAMGLRADQKYQQPGNGSGFADCYRLVKKTSSVPLDDARRLLEWQIFNVLAGNSDAHAKNLSFLYLPGNQIRLAPFYDLVCTRAIERIDDKLAMEVGGESHPGAIRMQHWHELAKACDARPSYVEKLVTDTAQKLEQSVPEVRSRFEQQYGNYPALQRVDQVIERQLQKLR
jgi:serine/threonine-protein kinase HipA